MQQADGNFLETLVRAARKRVESGYYVVGKQGRSSRRSLMRAIREPGRTAVVAEVKFRSPSEGTISPHRDVVEVSMDYQRGGAAAISVLTEPDNFGGSITFLSLVSNAVSVPVMMKDVVIDKSQVEAGTHAGADAILLIAGIFSSGMAQCSIDEMAGYAHARGLEVVVEAHDEEELNIAARSQADIIGINNRDLRTLTVSLETSRRLLLRGPQQKPIICESGITKREDIERLLPLGANGFLVGTALMKAADPVAELRKLSRGGAR